MIIIRLTHDQQQQQQQQQHSSSYGSYENDLD